MTLDTTTTTDTKRRASAAKRRTSKGSKGATNTGTGKASNGASAARMAEVRAARTNLGGRPRDFKRPAPGWNTRNVSRLARDGCESGDIAEILQIAHVLKADAEKRATFENLVASGHAEFRIRLQHWLLKSASTGGSNAIKSLAGVWLEKFSDLEQHRWDEKIAGASDRITALIAKHKKSAKRNRRDKEARA